MEAVLFSVISCSTLLAFYFFYDNDTDDIKELKKILGTK